MNIDKKLENISKNYDLEFDFDLKYLELSCREIIIRNFICGCPDPVYEKHRKKYSGNLNESLPSYLSSDDYKKDVKRGQACVVNKKYLHHEIEASKKIFDLNLRKETIGIYSKIEKEMRGRERLTLIWNDNLQKYESQKSEILLHEFVHELLENNGIKPKGWKWNEGLVTYITYKEINELDRVKIENQNSSSSEMWKIYAEYTRRWMNILEQTSPGNRKKIILEKIKSIEQ